MFVARVTYSDGVSVATKLVGCGRFSWHTASLDGRVLAAGFNRDSVLRDARGLLAREARS